MISEHARSRVRGRLLACIVSLCALACPIHGQASRAYAQGEDGSNAAYRGLIDQALDEFKRKNWPEARVLFRRAHELSPNARTLRGMGMVSYEMRDYVNAVVELSGAMSEGRQPLTEVQRKECEGLLGRSRTFVGAYTLVIEPAQANVSLDGATPVRDAEGRLLVPFGEHTLRGSEPGYLDEEIRLSVEGGEQGQLRLALAKPPAVAVSREEFLEPQSMPPTNPFGVADPASEPTTQTRGGLRYSWLALGATAAFGAGAVASWFVGQGKLDDLDSQCARQASSAPCVRGGVDTGSVKTLERTTNALLGLTAASLVATVVLAGFEWPRERRSIALQLGPQRLSLRGSF
jgi:hypothetical protein